MSERPVRIGALDALVSRCAALSFPVVAAAQTLLIGVSLFVFLRGWERAIKVPFGFSIDSLFYLMQAKSTIDNGWWWFNPVVGAPLGLDELAFPSNSNVDQIIIWTVSRFVHDPLAAVNLSWTLMVVVSGLAATWCMRTLNASLSSSLVAGTLFALSPYALYRNIAHFSLAIYLVPFVSAAAVQLASGRLPERGYFKGSGAVLLAGSALLAFNYVYYPFFGCFLIVVATIVGAVAHNERHILRAGGLFLVVIAGCTILNLAPSLYSWSRNGQPIILVDKVPAQAEVYGLKIRTLISPTFQHPFPLFHWWTEKEATAQFPLETENRISRLGFVGTLGFLGLLGLLMIPSAVDHSGSGAVILSASRLTIAAVLLATIGGFGSLFSLLISPQIRAYNRICPFIEFYALLAVGLAVDLIFRTGKGRAIATAIVLAIGLADQWSGAQGMNATYASIAAELHSLKRFVNQLESRLPEGAMVLQLPFRTYLNDSGTARMQPYKNLKPYLVSHSIRWSYPAFSNEQVAWQEAAGALDPWRLPYQLVYEGFAAIVIDRYGYEDNGVAVTAAIRSELRDQDILAKTDRYIALDIRSLANTRGVATSPLPKRLTAATLALRPCGLPAVMSVDQIGATRAPFRAGPVHVRGAEALKVSGWAVDQQLESAAGGVDVVVDQRPFPTFFGSDRPDVADSYRRPAYRRSGFFGQIPANTLTKGPHTLSLRVIASGRECYYEGRGIPIVVD